ncbi:NRDE family protein [Pseudomonas sp. Gutcm_11s]|uniref:NRDE family protein n=1 Tax=Pseudomonas sp. Gutcm_11s TaxID=3026088 RepID=UPI00235EAFF1|nr:NRDE family protein [Pseudomonas sp. Gutcm_11s]MDD0842287.1 NRDE family protein [Pseudomonas sp. Gutcm_11s]
MCLIVFAWRPGHPQPLVLAANRDEFYARSSLPLGEWEESPGVYAGRDLQAGGTWLGVTTDGRFAAVTNIRDPRQAKGARSRGELPLEFLRGELDGATYLERLAPRASDYSGFNLLLGDRHALYFLNSEAGQVRRLEAGLYGLSNADLDTPWPKVLRATAGLAGCLDDPQPERLLQVLQDASHPPRVLLPDTGIGLDWELLLSSVFIAGPGYGTCASSALILQDDGGLQLVERRFDAQGQGNGDVTIALAARRPESAH